MTGPNLVAGFANSIARGGRDMVTLTYYQLET